MNRWAWNIGVGAIDTAIAFFWLKQCTAPLAIIEPLAGVRRHGFGFNVITFRTRNRRFQFDRVCLRLHNAYPVIARKKASAGNST